MENTVSLASVKGIIFDYGGTIDSGGKHWSEVIWEAYHKAGVAVGKPEFREAYVFAERELARTLHILPHHTFADLLLIKVRIELEHLCREGLFAPAEVEAKAAEIAGLCYDAARASIAAARPVLEQLAARYPMVLVSNFYGNIASVLTDFGIRHFFDKIIESAVVEVRKPDPRIFILGVEALGMDAADVLVVGDSFTKDIEPALKAGCHAVWLKGKGWTPEEDARVFNPIITSLSQLPALLGLK